MLWAQARQLLQLHGSGPHAFQYRRQPSQFLVLGRRYHDSHKSRRFTEFRSIQQQQTSSSWQSFITVGICSIWKQSASHVSGRLGPQEIGAELMRESVATTLFSSQSKGKKDRDTLCIRWEREHLQNIFQRKGDLAVRGEREAQQILYQAEAEAEARNWERRNSDFAFREINQEFESQRFQLHQASPWADQAQRDKINMYGDLELRKRPFQEDHARDCQEFEELRRICCEEIDQAIQARIEELSSLQQHRNPSIASQMVVHIRDLQNEVNSLSDAREFHDLESREQFWSDPRSRSNSTILTSRILPRCDSGSPRNTHNCTGIMGNVFERPFVQEGWFSIIFHNSKNFVVDICRFKETRRTIIRSRLRSSVHMLSNKKSQKRWAQ